MPTASIVLELRRLGHDVLTIQETGNANKEYPDERVLEAATSDNRSVLTINRKDFIRLHRKAPNHAGIVICTSDRNFVDLAQRIHDAIESSVSLAGSLIRVQRPNL